MTQRTANGWAVLAPNSRLLNTWTVPGTGRDPVEIRLRHGSAGFLLVHDMMFWDEEIERLDLAGPKDEWGHVAVPREVRGGGAVTNHAAGLATDKNSVRHPRGVPTARTMTPSQMRSYRAHLKVYDGCLAWGGDWPSHPGSTALPDAMHTEVPPGVILSDCERVARRLLDSNARRVKAILKANPGQERVILS